LRHGQREFLLRAGAHALGSPDRVPHDLGVYLADPLNRAHVLVDHLQEMAILPIGAITGKSSRSFGLSTPIWYPEQCLLLLGDRNLRSFGLALKTTLSQGE